MRVVGLLAVIAVASALCCTRRTPMPPLTGIVADRAQPLSLVLKRYPGGEPVELAKHRGQVVLLDVWATWCEPCKDALPTYEQLAREYGGRGLVVYGLNVDEDPSLIPPFLAETKVTFPILIDQNARVAEQVLKVKLMPTSFIIDKRGVIRHVHEGFAEEFLARYQAEIEQLLAEKVE